MIRRLKRALGIRFSTKALARNPAIYLRQMFRPHREIAGLVAELAARRPVTIVQIGANDGATNDPLGEMIRSRPDRIAQALLIEPQPGAFARLEARYRDVAHIRCLNAAIDRQAGERVIYSVDTARASERLGRTVSDGLASFARAHPEKLLRSIDPALNEAELDALITATTVQVMPVREAMATAGMTDADVLLVDTEGYDAEIMEMALDAGLRPELVQFEHVHLDRPALRRLSRRLEEEGYRLWASHRDIWGQRVGTGASPR